jgi:hypothetical protein
METLCLLSYRGARMPRAGGTNGPRYTLRGAHGESIEGCRSTSDLALSEDAESK